MARNKRSHKQNPRKQTPKHKNVNKQDDTAAAETDMIDKLPDDILIAILSYMSIKDAVRTSVLSSRWRYLWTFKSGTLEFDDSNFDVRIRTERRKFRAMVNTVLKLHQSRGVDTLILRFSGLRGVTSDVDSWLSFAILHKELEMFELDLFVEDELHCNYEFPSIDKLLSFKSSVFGSLRSLKLVGVDIKDVVVRYLLSSCPLMEYLCIRASDAIKNLEVVDPLPNLKELEISDCCNLESLEISAANLVSCTYQGSEIDTPFKKTPNLTELTLGGLFCNSIVVEPNKHSSYSVQLVKLVLNLETAARERTISSLDLPYLNSLKRLELNIWIELGRSLIFVTSFIKASPNLEEFKIKIEYLVQHDNRLKALISAQNTVFRYVMPTTACGFFHHENLKVVEMAGFVGYYCEEKFLVELFKVAPSIETVTIDTRNDFDSFLKDGQTKSNSDVLREQTKEWAKRVKRSSPPRIKFVII